MKHALLTAAALAALATAAPALAQYTDSPPAAPATPAPAPEATMPATPSPEAAAPAPASPEAAMTPQAAQTPADWATFDHGNKGYLTALEFGNWMMAKQGQDMSAQVNKTMRSKQSNLPAVKVLNATGSAFLKADKNGDRHITPDELASAVAG